MMPVEIVNIENSNNSSNSNNSVDKYNYQYFNDQYNRIWELCKMDKLKIAHNLLIELEYILENEIGLINQLSNENEQFKDIIESIKSEKRFHQLKKEMDEIFDLQKQASSDFKSEGWVEISNTQGILSMYRDNGHGMHSIRIEGVVDSPIFDVCSVIMEVDLYSTWIPRLLESKILDQDSRFKKWIYCKSSCPWPVADRDICLYGYGVDMLEEEDLIVVVSKSMSEADIETNAKVKENLPKANTSTVRVDTRISGFTLKPLSKDKTFVQVVALTDPRMKLIPYWLLNFVTNQFCHYLFVMLRKQSLNVSKSNEYQTRITSNPIYKEIKEKSEFYFNTKHHQ
ncbi:hypothetical protein CYY_008456 [Polysphondylium violaceum]|uniref:START domain-containing protein n=1 Tax=Polysphondylium violaceum TaxID=133409 RepID=A0A8J4PNH7_9MYCE|nr:hypothetical protein CYY_008456 [Polysphondylium violaceum]